MEDRTPTRHSLKSKYWNMLLWGLIVVITLLLGGLTIWASRQPEVRSVWAPDE